MKTITIESITPLGSKRVKYLTGKCYFCGKRLRESDAAYLVSMREHPASLICGDCYREVNE